MLPSLIYAHHEALATVMMLLAGCLFGCLFGCLSLTQVDAQRSAMVSPRLQTAAGQQRGLLSYTLHSLRCWR